MYMRQFEKKKEYLICVDSDGCAMDTMDIKHMRFFGPCMVDEWHLTPWREVILERWNTINLYSMTRGINRFRGLAMALQEVNEHICDIPGIDVLLQWVEKSDELSEPALERWMESEEAICLRKALSWSKEVNRQIDALAIGEKRPFDGVKEALCLAHTKADIAVVSSANRKAVEEEWDGYDLLDFVDVLCAQDDGSKEYCIRKLLQKGYEPSNVMMVGDAPGDYEAAKKNQVFFYPILVRNETESWNEFQEDTVKRLVEGRLTEDYQRKKVELFKKNLGK